MMRLSVTGHRPEKLGGYSIEGRNKLYAFARLILNNEVAEQDTAFHVVQGMAQGWDQAVCDACVVLGIPVHARVPFEGQERHWPADAQTRYRRLLARCETVTVTSPTFTDDAYLKRNRQMVDESQKLLSLSSGTGGSEYTVRYAREQGVQVVDLWPLWEKFRERPLVQG